MDMQNDKKYYLKDVTVSTLINIFNIISILAIFFIVSKSLS